MDDGAVSCNVGDASEDKAARCDATHKGVQGDMVGLRSITTNKRNVPARKITTRNPAG